MKRLKRPLLSRQLDLQLSNITKLLLSAESDWARHFWQYTKDRLLFKYDEVREELGNTKLAKHEDKA